MTTNNTETKRAELRRLGLTSTSKFTFAAIIDGETIDTRTSGTMLYSHALVVSRTTEDNRVVLSWHLTEAAAHKAAQTRYVLATYPVRQVVPVTITKVTGRPAPGELMPNSDELVVDGKYRLRTASVPTDAERARAIAEAQAADAPAEEVDDKAAKARAIAERLNAQAADAPADADSTTPAAVRKMFAGLGWSVTEPVDVEVVEPIVSVTADGDTAPAEGRQVNKRTRENMAACAAVGLSYWADHPKPSHVWAVDADQQAHPVRIDRKRNLAIIAEPNDAIGGNPLRSWSIDPAAQAALIGAAEVADAINADKAALVTINGPADEVATVAQAVVDGSVSFTDAVRGALGDKLIVGHIGAPVESLSAPRLGNLESVNHAITDANAEVRAMVADANADEETDSAHNLAAAEAKATAVLSVTARKALLGDLVQDTLGKMIADMTADDLAALGYDTADAVTAQLKSWLRRSGRAFVYKDGHNVSGGDAD